MNQTADIAAEMLKNPTDDLRGLMDDPRTSDAAREAIASLASSPPMTDPGRTAVPNGVSQLGDGRLQVVNEHQVFTYVPATRQY